MPQRKEEVAVVITTVVDGWHGANRGMRILAIKSRIIVIIFFFLAHRRTFPFHAKVISRTTKELGLALVG